MSAETRRRTLLLRAAASGLAAALWPLRTTLSRGRGDDATPARGPVTALRPVAGGVVVARPEGLSWRAGGGEERPLWTPSPADAWRPVSIATLARPSTSAGEAAGGAARLLVGGGLPAERGELLVLEVDLESEESPKPSARELARRRVSGDLVYAVAAGPGSARFAVGCAKGPVLIGEWDEDAEKLLASARESHRHSGAVRDLAFSSDGRWLVSGGLDGTLRLVDLAGGRGTRTLTDHTDAIERVAPSPDGTLLASSARDGKVRLHELESGRLRRSWLALGDAVWGLAWLDDSRLAAGLADGRLLELAFDPRAEPKIIARRDRPVRVLVRGTSPDGATRLVLAAGSDVVCVDVPPSPARASADGSSPHR